MKKITFLLLSAAALFAGCVVTSVCPFYNESDLAFEPALVGNWLKPVEDGQHEVWKFEQSGPLTYRFTLMEQHKATVMEARAFRLQGELFIDVFSNDQDVHVIPPHFLLRVNALTPAALQLAELNNDWLKHELSRGSIVIPHHLVRHGDKPDDLHVVLTADTAELQRFVLAHLKTDSAWSTLDLTRESALATAPAEQH